MNYTANNMEYKRICRICLIESSKVDDIMQNCDILYKTSSFIHGIVIDSLPQTVCKLCVEKIESFYTFHGLIIKNQNTLLNRIKNVNNTAISSVDEVKGVVKKETDIASKENEIQKDPKIELEQNNLVSNENNASKDELNEIEEIFDYGSDDEHLELNPTKQEEMTLGHTGRCLTCFKINFSKVDLLKHYNVEHKSKLQEDIPRREDEKYEMVAADGCMRFKCKKCDKMFGSRKQINKHTISHVEDRPFVCKLCGRTYRTASEIVRHGRAHNGSKMPCKYECGFNTVYLGALKQHERWHRSGHTYKCEKCGKGFQVLTWYEQHQNIHKGVKPFVCQICGVAFHMDRYLKSHMTTVHPQASSRKRFVCVHCLKPCDSKKGLTLHLKEHGITTLFLCDVCGKVLSEARQLKLHKRTHLGEKPYSCGICNKTFTKKFNLKLHARTHTGERAHACSHCGRRYTQRGTLLRHVQRFHKGNISLEAGRNET